MIPVKSSISIASTSPTRDRMEKEQRTPSPKRKKVFTVARSIPSTPTLELSGANDTLISPGKSKEEIKTVLNKQVRRDNNGKIPVYAALGTQEDIETFDNYLQSVPASNGTFKSTRGKNVSTKTLKRAASRLTKSLSTRTIASEAPSTNRQGKQNAETPNPTAREEAPYSPATSKKQSIEYKKMLRSLPIHERISKEREKKVLLIWETRNREWEQFRAKMAKKLNKPEQDLVMVKASDYRKQMEEYDLISKATPQEEKHGNEYWSVSLRDEGTRFVPVGNVFSGLFCPVKEDKNPMTEIIRRPMDTRVLKSLKTQHEGKFNEALLARKRQLRRNIQQIRPHQVDDEHCDVLKVESLDLFEWAATSSQKHYDELLQEERQQENESNARMLSATSNLNESTEEPSGLKTTPREETIVGPCLEILETRNPSTCPPLDLHLSFHTKIGTVQSRDLWIYNPSSITVHYVWAHSGPSHRDFAIEAAGMHARTFISQETGILLPRETKRVRFNFQSATPGIFLERWKVIIDPYLAQHNNEALYASERTVHLTCAAVDHQAPYQARKTIAAAIDKRSTHYMIENLLRQILDDIDYPERPFRDLAEEQKQAEFERLNRQLCVHYSREVYESLQLLYERAQNLIVADKQAKLMQPGESTEASPRTAPAANVPWDGHLVSLAQLAKEADAISRLNFKAATPRKDDEEEDDEDESDGDDEDDEDGDSISLSSSKRVKKAVFKPLFQLTYEELRYVAQFRPHDPSIFFNDIAQNLAFLCSEMPVVANILELEQSADIHGELSEYTSNFIRKAVDEGLDTLFQKETALAVQHFQRLKMWIQDKATVVDGLFKLSSPPTSANIAVHVDLDLAHCFVLGPRPDGAAASTLPVEGGGLQPVPSEWTWMEGIDTFVPAKISRVASLLQTIVQGYKNQFESNSPSSPCVVNIVLVSSMSQPPKQRGKQVKRKHNEPPLLPPDATVPSMKSVSNKLQQVLSMPIEFVGSLETLSELAAPPPAPVIPSEDNPSPPETVEPTVEAAATISFRIHLLESFDLLRNPPVARTEIPTPAAAAPADEKPKDEKKDKGGKKAPPPAKKEEDTKQASSDKPHTVATSVVYESQEAKWKAIWDGTYTDVFADILRGWVDVTIADTFGGDNWATILAMQPSRQLHLLGPQLHQECIHIGEMMQPHNELVLRNHPRGKLAAILNGPSFTSKIWLLDGLLEVADEIYIGGAMAATLLRYFHLTKEDRKSCAGENGFDLQLEPGMSYRVMDAIRNKAERYCVKIFLPFDWKVGDTPIDTNETSNTDGDGTSQTDQAQDEEEDNEEQEEEDEEEEEEEEENIKKSKKSKKKNAPKPIVIVNEPPVLPSGKSTQSYDGMVLHLTYTTEATDIENQGWLCIDELSPGCLSRFLCRSKSPVDGLPLPTPPVREWTFRTFDTGPLSMQKLLQHHLSSFNRLVVAGLPGRVEFVEFQSSSKELATYLEQRQDFELLVVGKHTIECIRRNSNEQIATKLQPNELNANVTKYLVAGQQHPAILALSNKSK